MTHSGVRSVWFRNSVRGAAGLAIAVFIAQTSGLQHSFWVVLGTLSVLRSNALGTGWTVLTALAGTAAGILVGAAILIPVHGDTTVLWAVLPVAVLIAAYAPRVISFAAGQAAFTVVVLILFNIIQPAGWKVGIVRIEDVAVGFADQPGRGPGVLAPGRRGAGPGEPGRVLLEDRGLRGRHGGAADRGGRRRRPAAGRAGRRRRRCTGWTTRSASTWRNGRPSGWTRNGPRGWSPGPPGCSGPAARWRRSRNWPPGGRPARRTAAPSPPWLLPDGLRPCAGKLEEEAQSIRAWFVTLGDSVAHGTAVPPPQRRDPAVRSHLLQCTREAISSGQPAEAHDALLVLWVNEHLEMLWRLERHLGRTDAGQDVPAPATLG